MGYMMFYVSWSPREGEATYTRCFPSAVERDGFAAGLSKWCKVRTWENYYERRA